MYVENYGQAGGHGRYFMVMSAAMNEAVSNLFGLALHMGTFNDWSVDWYTIEYLRSVHKMKTWKWLQKIVKYMVARIQKRSCQY